MPQSFCRYPRSAFTLIEILIVAVIFSILSLAVGRFLITFLNLKLSAETIQRIRQEGNYALDQIDYLLRSGLTMPDVCVGRIRPANPPSGFSLHANLHVVTDNPDPNNIMPAPCVGEPKDPDPFSVIAEKPIHCELDPTQSSPSYSSHHSKIYDTCQENCYVYDQLRTNTQGLDDKVYFVRNLVALAACDGSSGSSGCRQPSSSDEVSSLYLFRSLDADRRHGDFNNFAISPQVQNIPLTNWRTGVGGEPFSVNNLRFYCFFDYFANSYVVHTSFDITYQRQSLSGRLLDSSKQINERFERLSVVRNPYPFEY